MEFLRISLNIIENKNKIYVPLIWNFSAVARPLKNERWETDYIEDRESLNSEPISQLTCFLKGDLYKSSVFIHDCLRNLWLLHFVCTNSFSNRRYNFDVWKSSKKCRIFMASLFNYVKYWMMTIRRTFIILVLLAIVFFIYRGINPIGADRLLTNIRNIPVRLWFLSREYVLTSHLSTGEHISSSGTLITTGTLISKIVPSTKKSQVFTSSLISGGTFALESLIFRPKTISSTGDALVFSSTLASGWLFAMEALVIPQQNTTPIQEPIATWWSLTIVSSIPVGEEKPLVVNKQTVGVKPTRTSVVPQSKASSSRITAQDISLLNNLFQ